MQTYAGVAVELRPKLPTSRSTALLPAAPLSGAGAGAGQGRVRGGVQSRAKARGAAASA